MKVTGKRGATPMSIAVTTFGSTPVLKLLTARGAQPALTDVLDAGMMQKLAWASLVMALGFGGYYGLTGLYPTLLRGDGTKLPLRRTNETRIDPVDLRMLAFADP